MVWTKRAMYFLTRRSLWASRESGNFPGESREENKHARWLFSCCHRLLAFAPAESWPELLPNFCRHIQKSPPDALLRKQYVSSSGRPLYGNVTGPLLFQGHNLYFPSPFIKAGTATFYLSCLWSGCLFAVRPGRTHDLYWNDSFSKPALDSILLGCCIIYLSSIQTLFSSKPLSRVCHIAIQETFLRNA